MIVLVRHGETEWSSSGRQTSFTDLPLTKHGQYQAKALRPFLQKYHFESIWCSPLLRARHTCSLAGFNHEIQIIPELTEWHAGEYEGQKTADIQKVRPGWNILVHGAPGGESPLEIQARLDRIIPPLRANASNTLIFSSSFLIRALTCRLLNLPSDFGTVLRPNTGSISVLDIESHQASIRLWNLRPPEFDG